MLNLSQVNSKNVRIATLMWFRKFLILTIVDFRHLLGCLISVNFFNDNTEDVDKRGRLLKWIYILFSSLFLPCLTFSLLFMKDDNSKILSYTNSG